MEALIRITLLGQFQVQQGSREISRFRTQKTASLLACLALKRSRSHPRDILIEQFWPESGLKAARTNLSVALNALRRQLEPPGIPSGAVLIADHTQVCLNPIAFTTDVEDFENALREAEQEAEAANRLTAWIKAIELYRGGLLPGFYEEWVLPERDRLHNAYQSALRNVVKTCVELGQTERALEYAYRLVQADRLREESYRTLMRLLVAVGRPHEAVYQYQELERRLKEELQTTPTAATRELFGQLKPLPLTRRVPLETPTSDSPPKETAETAPPPTPKASRPTLKVPLQFTRFFGREEELEKLCAWLGVGRNEGSHASLVRSTALSEQAGVTRLITLTGPGGTGKTRLSIELARRIKDAFPAGLWFVPLAELNDPLRLGEALRDALELPLRTQPGALEQVTAYLREREQPVLLILDNLEQIAGGVAPVVWTLLNRVPLLQCLVTSRHPLALPGEREVSVLPLPVPGEEETSRENVEGRAKPKGEPRVLLTYPSVALFVDRAQTARPEFQITPGNATEIAAICRKLEGIPLAIELAAARVKTLTPAQIGARLSERFELLASQRSDRIERHRSLWAAIDWSYHLLSPPVQRFFARLSLFHGGWTLEAAEAVCQEEAIGHLLSPLDILTQLRGHSLIEAEESSDTLRFRMLESLREFAVEQLPSEEREAIARRHAAYFHQWVNSAPLIGEERTAWFARFEMDMDNLRAVLAWSLQEGNAVEIGLETAGACRNFWWVRGHIEEGRHWYARLLERAGEVSTAALSVPLHGAGTLALMQGDFLSARPLLERCMETALTSGNEEFVVRAHEALGSISYRQGEYASARSHFERSLTRSRAMRMPHLIASALGNLANVAQSTGDFSTSRLLNVESLAAWREAGDRNGEARTLSNLGNLELSQGQLAEARAYYEQSLALKYELADRYAISASLTSLAEVNILQRDYAAAAAQIRQSLALAREMGARSLFVDVLKRLIDLTRAMEDWEAAAQMSGTLEKTRDEMNYPLEPVNRPAYEQSLSILEQALGTAAYESARRGGRELSLEQALTGAEETLAKHSL